MESLQNEHWEFLGEPFPLTISPALIWCFGLPDLRMKQKTSKEFHSVGGDKEASDE
jgi:hypothetical protein